LFRPAANGSFVPFTIIARGTTNKAMQKVLRSTPQLAGDALEGELLTAKSPAESDVSVLSSLDRALIEAAEEMSFDWPEFSPLERIKARFTQIAVGIFPSLGARGVGWLANTVSRLVAR
jgi:hypothetical protein